MDASAIIMMVLFLLVIWGGLVASIVHYAGHPDDPEEATTSPAREL
ncbi:putative methionine/alanine importer small subunit [Dietzia natronolimnaea]|uniref:Putative methionine/alanine importer small subunit n=1 Tax=Dietzia natronolimnaea TaxID=161920 RepID=A0A2A2WLV2_9ACTN|nr:methionine/alanine import family NSS transporter small subunit [Dietzia natronolimnaea]PAY21934.1 putative methionine/alanine importer small subunit [Dietzia natronolimnaea]